MGIRRAFQSYPSINSCHRIIAPSSSPRYRPARISLCHDPFCQGYCVRNGRLRRWRVFPVPLRQRSAARMQAAIRSTRFPPSCTLTSVAYSLFIRHNGIRRNISNFGNLHKVRIQRRVLLAYLRARTCVSSVEKQHWKLRPSWVTLFIPQAVFTRFNELFTVTVRPWGGTRCRPVNSQRF